MSVRGLRLYVRQDDMLRPCFELLPSRNSKIKQAHDVWESMLGTTYLQL